MHCLLHEFTELITAYPFRLTKTKVTHALGAEVQYSWVLHSAVDDRRSRKRW
jgi:hypothetical protein